MTQPPQNANSSQPTQAKPSTSPGQVPPRAEVYAQLKAHSNQLKLGLRQFFGPPTNLLERRIRDNERVQNDLRIAELAKLRAEHAELRAALEMARTLIVAMCSPYSERSQVARILESITDALADSADKPKEGGAYVS